MVKTAEELLEFIAGGPNHMVSKAEIFSESDDRETFRAKAAILHELVESGRVIDVPLFAGTSGDGSYCLPDSPELPGLIKLHAEWNAKHPELAERWPAAKAFGERSIYSGVVNNS